MPATRGAATGNPTTPTSSAGPSKVSGDQPPAPLASHCVTARGAVAAASRRTRIRPRGPFNVAQRRDDGLAQLSSPHRSVRPTRSRSTSARSSGPASLLCNLASSHLQRLGVRARRTARRTAAEPPGAACSPARTAASEPSSPATAISDASVRSSGQRSDHHTRAASDGVAGSSSPGSSSRISGAIPDSADVNPASTVLFGADQEPDPLIAAPRPRRPPGRSGRDVRQQRLDVLDGELARKTQLTPLQRHLGTMQRPRPKTDQSRPHQHLAGHGERVGHAATS